MFLFVENSVINNLGTTGVVKGNKVEMTAVKGEGESKKFISFDSEVMGDTLNGEYSIKNNSDAVIESGEFAMTRI